MLAYDVPMSILSVNAGSSSLKVALFTAERPPRRLRALSAERIGKGGPRDHVAALGTLLASLDMAEVSAVGHRLVHGGPRLDRAMRIDQPVLDELKQLSALDPNHLPAELAVIESLRRERPSLPQVACFDTAFHRTLPRVAQLLPIPRRYQAQGIRRYGFHGLSYAFLMEELGRLGAAGGRVILAHLGAGASLAAVLDGRCVDTTMAFTPTAGIMMGTRTGDLDPGVLVHLARSEGLTAAALDELVNAQSGLLGVSELSADVRDLLAREASDPRAADALALFCQGVKKAIGALAAVLGGVDTLVFAGGIGEHAAPLRARSLEGLGHLGIALDGARNDASAAVISLAGSPCTVHIIHTDEESMIARETLDVLQGGTP
jgi:acetate kinase